MAFEKQQLQFKVKKDIILQHFGFFPSVDFLMVQMQSKSQAPSWSYFYKRSYYKRDDVMSVKVSNITAFRFTAI